MKLEKPTKSQQAQSFAIRASRWASICSLSHVRKSSFGSLVAAGSFAFCMWTSNCPLWAAKASGISSSGRCKQSQTRKRSLVSKINKADLRHVCYQSMYKPRQKSRCFAGVIKTFPGWYCISSIYQKPANQREQKAWSLPGLLVHLHQHDLLATLAALPLHQNPTLTAAEELQLLHPWLCVWAEKQIVICLEQNL